MAQDRPTRHELLQAVRQFLETDVVPTLDGTKKFHARVAANVLGIVQRELALEESQLAAEWSGLNELLQSDGAQPPLPSACRDALRQRTEQLCERIRNGDADSGAWRAAVLRHVRQTVIDKLAVAKPDLVQR